MNKQIIILTVLILSFTLQLRAQTETQFLLNGPMDVNGFGGPLLEFSWVRNQPILSVGGGGGALLNKSFFIGGYGIGNTVTDALYTFNNEPVSLQFGHGGLWLGYLHNADRVAHWGLSSKFGWGGLGLLDSNDNLIFSDDIFLIQPQLQGEVNLLPFMKISAAAGYRFSLGVQNAFFQPSDINSPFGILALYFGWFGD